NFSFALPQLDGRGRLGVTLEELTPQLAKYFGAKDGVLIASVREDSPASRAGLKAGDVITKVNNEPVGSRDDLMRLVRDVKDGAGCRVGRERFAARRGGRPRPQHCWPIGARSALVRASGHRSRAQPPAAGRHPPYFPATPRARSHRSCRRLTGAALSGRRDRS